MVQSSILNDLLSQYSVEYCYKYKKYPPDASNLGIEFENKLKKLFILEEELRTIAISTWKNRLTAFSDIVNGEDFMVVVHASYNLPGTKDCPNYRPGKYAPKYLSGSLLTNNELNTFNSIKTLYILNVDEDNYISLSSFDSVTADFNNPSFETLKEIYEGTDVHFIKVGYTHDKDKAVTAISTPNLIEHLSIQRELQRNRELFNYDELLTNEVVLDRTTTRIMGALLLSDGCDLLLTEYLFFKKNNIKFKCLNKGLYREKNGLQVYTSREFETFMNSLQSLEEYIKHNKLSFSILLDYYNEVVLPMKYSDEIMNIIKEKFSKYIDIHELESNANKNSL